MILLYAIFFILLDAVLNRRVLSVLFFGVFLLLAFSFEGYYVENWKIIIGYLLIRIATLDLILNLIERKIWHFYRNEFMANLGGFGWFVKMIFGLISIVFLTGVN